MKFLFLAFAAYFSISVFAQHSTWNSLLQKHVNSENRVDYQGFQNDAATLDKYLESLAKSDPAGMGEKAAKALWLNAYNAYTVKLILENYPLKSIRDIEKNGKDAWDIPFAEVGGKNYTLDQIEHEILLEKYPDYRIHAGVNCASISCPPLIREAFTAENVDALFEKSFKDFVNDSQRNKISQNELKLSKVFDWFKDDFESAGGVLKVIQKYSKKPIPNNPKISYLEYDWNLNSQ